MYYATLSNFSVLSDFVLSYPRGLAIRKVSFFALDSTELQSEGNVKP